MAIKKCEVCRKNPVTVNYKRKGKTYYRKVCYHCAKKKKAELELPAQLLKKSGYKKKTICDRCGFKAKTANQIRIFYKDGNSYNVSLPNLRSFCLNCCSEIEADPGAAARDILADF